MRLERRHILKRVLSGLLALCFLLLTGCADHKETKYVFAMDTVMELTACGRDAQAGLAAAEAVILELEDMLSVTDPNSELSTLNRESSGTPSAELYALLEAALALCADTEGALDVTVYPVLRAWGFTTDSFRIPEAAELEQLLMLVDHKAVTLLEGKVSLPEGVLLDLGGVAKGWCGDRAAQAMEEAGVDSALLNLGGNVRCVGCSPNGEPWRIAVKNPLEPESANYLGVLEAADVSVVTSGGYERCFEQDGQTYWHILDPETGEPARSGLLSVTVVCANGLRCDGLSTALFVMGAQDALAYWRSSGSFEAILVEENGTVTVTAGLAQHFTLLDTQNFTLKIAE